jgi:membrane associated rhomboid family serine protease
MFLPIGDENHAVQRWPFIVWGLMGLNFYAWYLQLTIGPEFTYAYAATALEITKGKDLVGMFPIQVEGSKHLLPHFVGPEPVYLTLFSSMFLHGSWMHILGNMLYLWIFGDQIEDLIGHFKFLLFYLSAGVVGSLAHVFSDPGSIIPSLGASGAIAGVLGAYLIKFPGNRVKVLVFRNIVMMPASLVLGAWVVLQFIGQAQSGATKGGGVAYMAHIGGFLAGIILVSIFGAKSSRAKSKMF